jgi:uncharacterized protein (UPF0261 family)
MSVTADLRILTDTGTRRVPVRVVSKAGAIRMVQLQAPLNVGDYVARLEDLWLENPTITLVATPEEKP